MPEDVTAALLLDADGSAEVARGAPIFTDDYNLLQIRSPRLRRPLGTRAAESIAAPFDPLPRLARDRSDPFYLIHQIPLKRAQQLAESLGISRPGFESLLRKAENKLIAAVFPYLTVQAPPSPAVAEESRG